MRHSESRNKGCANLHACLELARHDLGVAVLPIADRNTKSSRFWRRVSSEGIHAHSIAMICRLFVGQFNESTLPASVLLKILQRDFGSLELLKSDLMTASESSETDYLVLGLSYVDFRFHIFSLSANSYGVPFALSPVLALVLTSNMLVAAQLDRRELMELYLSSLDWGAVESRVACLSEPLDLLDADLSECGDVCDSGGQSDTARPE